MKIVAIIKKDGTSYTVGIMPADLEGIIVPEDEAAFPTVEEITFCAKGKDLYNKGRQNSLPAYLVKIATSDIRRLVPESEIKEIHADIESHKKSEGKFIAELPENDPVE
jgi:hypothetical protein